MKTLLKHTFEVLICCAIGMFFAFAVFIGPANAANIQTKGWDYTCVNANTGATMVIHSNPAAYGSADFRLEVKPGLQVAIEEAAPVDIKGYPGFYHPETAKSKELTVIVLDNGKQIVTQYGSDVLTCGLTSEYNLVRKY